MPLCPSPPHLWAPRPTTPPSPLPSATSLSPTPGGEERPENNLQVPRRVGLVRRADLLEAAVALPRHGSPAQVPTRHGRARAERDQRRHGRDGAGGASASQPAHHGHGLPGGVAQLLQGLPLLARHGRPGVRQGHQLPEHVLRARLQHGHAPEQPVLPLPGALVLPRGVSDVREGGGGVHLQERLTSAGPELSDGTCTKQKSEMKPERVRATFESFCRDPTSAAALIFGEENNRVTPSNVF